MKQDFKDDPDTVRRVLVTKSVGLRKRELNLKGRETVLHQKITKLKRLVEEINKLVKLYDEDY